MDFKNEKKEKNNIKMIIGLIIFLLFMNSSIWRIKDDIGRVKDKIIKIHGYSISLNIKDIEKV